MAPRAAAASQLGGAAGGLAALVGVQVPGCCSPAATVQGTGCSSDGSLLLGTTASHPRPGGLYSPKLALQPVGVSPSALRASPSGPTRRAAGGHCGPLGSSYTGWGLFVVLLNFIKLCGQKVCGRTERAMDSPTVASRPILLMVENM